jgi:hypothetical protein
MKRLLVVVLLIFVNPAAAQTKSGWTVPAEKPCVAFISESSNSANDEPAKEPLRTAVTLSGDFDFYANAHGSCWRVRVIGMSIEEKNGGTVLGYVVAWVVTDPSGMFVDHGLSTSPTDRTGFDSAMRAAAASTVQDIRFRTKLQRELNASHSEKP